MTIIGFNGAPTRDGSVGHLLDEALQAAAAEGNGETTVTRIDLLDLRMPFHDGNFATTPTELLETFHAMRSADGFIFATPVNWYNVSSLMKCFIDWLTTLEDHFELEGKVAGVLAHCDSDGGNQAAMAIITPLLHMGVLIPPYCAFYRNKNVGERSENRWMMVDQALVGRNVVRLIRATKNKNISWKLPN